MAHVVFLRAANVGGKNVFRPAQLAAALAHLEVVNLGAAGTFVVRAPASAASIRREILSRLPFEPAIAVRPAREVVALVRSEPFRGIALSKDLRGWAAVLCGPPRTRPTLPLVKPAGRNWSVRFDRIDGPFALIKDLVGYRASAERAAAYGFDGKWVLHPGQIDAANETFSPKQEDYDHAENILDAYEWFTSEEGGKKGSAMLGDEMIDEASRKMALVVAGKGRAAAMNRTNRSTGAPNSGNIAAGSPVRRAMMPAKISGDIDGFDNAASRAASHIAKSDGRTARRPRSSRPSMKPPYARSEMA